MKIILIKQHKLIIHAISTVRTTYIFSVQSLNNKEHTYHRNDELLRLKQWDTNHRSRQYRLKSKNVTNVPVRVFLYNTALFDNRLAISTQIYNDS